MWIFLFVVGIFGIFFVLFITQDWSDLKEKPSKNEVYFIKDGRWTFAHKTYDELNIKERSLLGEHIVYEYETGY